MLLKYITQYKAEDLSKEVETRLVYLRHPGYHGNGAVLDVRFMPGNDRIPYVAFSLKNDKAWRKPFVEKLWQEARIVLSPRRPEKREADRESVVRFLESVLRGHHLPTDCASTVRVSELPYDPE